jgi:lipopolysaccharide heptosyltransferase I
MKILVIKPSSLGDIIHALPFLKSVKETFPESEIDWVISEPLMEILEHNPLINNLIPIDKDSWKKLKNLLLTISQIVSLKKNLQSKHYDIVVDLQGLLRSGLITFFARSDSKMGFADAREGSSLFYNRRVSASSAMHAVDRCLEVARAMGAQTDRIEFPLNIDKPQKEIAKNLTGNIDEYIVIVPSARWESKRWPAANFASLISEIPLYSVIVGSSGDNVIAEEIIGRAPMTDKTINLCGKTSLSELVALIAGAKAVVSNDSGPMHIAAALDKPTVAIFGPTDPNKTGPYGWKENSKLKVISAQVPCSPCREKECDDMQCMQSIEVKQVYEALRGFF